MTTQLYDVRISEVRRTGTLKRLAQWQRFAANESDAQESAKQAAVREFPGRLLHVEAREAWSK